VLLVLKKKELTILHVYHHTMTLLLTFVQLKERASVVPYLCLHFVSPIIRGSFFLFCSIQIGIGMLILVV